MTQPTTCNDFIAKIIQVWNHIITTDELIKLIDSMPDQIAAVIAAKGFPTKY